MNISKIFSYILIIFLIFKFICSDDNPQIEFCFEFEDKYKNNSDNSFIYPNFLFGNIKFLDDNNIFYNIPRNKEYTSINNNATFVKLNVTNNRDIKYEFWPNETYNDLSNMESCHGFVSIIAFEFDNNNNIYLLDEGNDNCPIILYKFNSEREILENYTIFENKTESLNIIDFVLDKVNNYIYISFYNNTDNIDYEYEEGFIIKKLEKDNKEAKIIFFEDEKLKYDKEYKFSKDNNFTDITKKLISTTLSCDGDVLFFAPISSRMIYSIKTKKLRKIKNNIIKIDDVNESYKNDASSAMISSNLGNLYLNGLEKDVIYIAGQIDKDLTIFDYKGVDKREKSDELEMGWPTKMSIYDGHLYIICKNTEENNDDTFSLKTQVFKLSIYKEKSYVYKCAGIGQKWDWETYSVWILFVAIVIFVLVFVFIGNKEDKVINKKD